MLNQKENYVEMRCDCAGHCCTLFIEKCKYEDEIDYNISMQDSYYRHNARLWNRLKNAFKILFAKPIYYNDVYLPEAKMKELVGEINELIKG